ncbi:hypothetical protein [Amycolatopsis magusensis]|uniref:hypothetical protein n=1 Tax=Amycolatopsis magusensis TaxID=882444 RepID=UPI0037B21174
MRRTVLALAGVAVLLVAGASGYLVVDRITQPSDEVPVAVTSSPSPEPPPPEPPPKTQAGEPATVSVWRSRTEDAWAQVTDVTPDRVGPVVTNPNDRSIHGSTGCGGSYEAVQAVSGRDARDAEVTVQVLPRSFQEITITDLRVRFLTAVPGIEPPNYLYQCVNPHGADGPSDFEVRADGLHEKVMSAKGQRRVELPDTVTAQRMEVWSKVVFVEVLGEAYEWQIEVDYLNNGKSYTAVRKADAENVPLITEPTTRDDDFDKAFVWCHEEKAFREGIEC